jgi:pumilio homology domain family member 6
MSGTKRKEAPSKAAKDVKKQKTNIAKPANPKRMDEEEEEFGGFSGDESDGSVAVIGRRSKSKDRPEKIQSITTNGALKKFKLDTSSTEAHAKQRALAKERKASKPNADVIQRSKKIWERLRLKSHVQLEERKQLVAELFQIITGRVRDFVFKHDSVRVIQCALKYANREQRRLIVNELKGDLRELAESRYGKFLVAKMVSTGDEEVRDLVVPQFYGHVKRLINHPEASWVVDDIYRQVATPEQKTVMLREWYGAEYALFHRKPESKKLATVTDEDTCHLSVILERSPEKRKPILQHLLQMINGLVQKRMTGFTMLHDAMLQYFLVLAPSSAEQTEFLEILKGDIDKETEGGGGDLFRNLAFTKSGSRLVCLALAYSSAKDRKIILKAFKDTIELMAFDQYAKLVLVTGLEVSDDTKMSTKSIIPELLGDKVVEETERLDRLESIITNLHARLPILFPMAGAAKWLVSDPEKKVIEEVFEIRKTMSKKQPEARDAEINDAISETLLDFIANRAATLAQTSFGCQFITETLLSTVDAKSKEPAKWAVANLSEADPLAEGHIAKSAAGGRMLKTLVTGGQFDFKEKKVKLADPRLGFAAILWPIIKDNIVEWACGASSFVVVALLESEDVDEAIKADVMKAIKKGSKSVGAAARGEKEDKKGNAGARILVEKMG